MTDRRTFLLATALAGAGLTGPGRAFAAAGEILAQADATPSGEADAAKDGAGPGTGTPEAAGEGAPAEAAAERFDFDRLVDRVQDVASRPYEKRTLQFEGDYANLTYDQLRDIRFRREADPIAAAGAPFGVDLLPPGFLFTSPVEVNLVEDGVVRNVPFTLDALDIGPLAPTPANPQDLAWSGFRLRNPVNRPDVLDEVAVFQGASYFRAVARGQRYGLSARGLAIDTASEKGEEFPEFTRFWIEVPGEDAVAVTVFALLDSASVAGAYRFELQPGAETVMRVRSVLFPRRDLDNVGIAPLTSMFLFDASNDVRFDDYRVAVHDSDGLQMINGRGERVFRPLANPVRLQISTFEDTDPVAFGLVQRHRRFDDYEDAEARYELRPGAWVQPTGKWGAGTVELVEIPTALEIHDNIAAYWRPAAVMKAGERQTFDYRLAWTGDPSDDTPLMRVRDLRIGLHARGNVREVVVDFRVPEGLSVDPKIDLSVTAGKVANVTGQVLEADGDYRVTFDFDAEDADSSDMRLQLQGPEGALGETFLYRWTA